MQIECTQENLLHALQLVSRMVGTRGTLPVLANILLKTEKGRLVMAATDLEMGVKTILGGKVTAEGGITVPARLLMDFVANNTDPTIVLESTDDNLQLASARFKANIRGIAASEFPLLPEVTRTQGISLPAGILKEAIQQTVFATAIDETRPVLTGALLKIRGTELKLVATDSYRLAEKTIKLAAKQPDLQTIIPARTLSELGRMLNDPSAEVTLYLAENQLLAVFGETELISRVIDGTFPDYTQIIPKTTQTELTIQKSVLAETMKLAALFARESANNVRLKVDGQGLVVEAVSPQLGDATSQLEAKVTGEPMEVSFNAKFILDALQVLPGETAELKLAGKLAPGILKSADRKDYLYLLMPLRVE